MSKNRFSAVKEQMSANLQENSDNEEELDESNGAETGASETNGNGKNKRTEPRNEPKMTRKTMTIPVVLDVAVKELKDSRNLGRQKGTSKNTEDEIITEALNYFFIQKGEFKEALEAAEIKVSKYG
jgi:hypothetical protein